MKREEHITETENVQLQKVEKKEKENKIKKVVEYIFSSRWYVLFIGIVILLKTILIRFF